MADNDNVAQAQPAAEPAPDIQSLGSRLVATWELSGESHGTVVYEWMEGGHFLIQYVDMGQQDSQRTTGIEVIGHEKTFGSEASAEIKSRFYSHTGDTLDYVYELEGDTLTIWGGEKGSPAYYRGTFSDDGNTLTGAWHWPGGGYEATSTRVG